LGDKVVLLTGKDGTHIKDVVIANLNVLAEVFKVIEPWSEKEPSGKKW